MRIEIAIKYLVLLPTLYRISLSYCAQLTLCRLSIVHLPQKIDCQCFVQWCNHFYCYRRYSIKTSYFNFWWNNDFLYLIGCQLYCAADGDITISKRQSESSKNGNFCVFQELVCHNMLVFWSCEYYSHNGTYEVLNCTYLSEFSGLKWVLIYLTNWASMLIIFTVKSVHFRLFLIKLYFKTSSVKLLHIQGFYSHFLFFFRFFSI